MNDEFIDICLATRNSNKTLTKLLDSIEKQEDLKNTRILVADNESNDGTLEILKKNNLVEIISCSDNSPEDGFNKLLSIDSYNLKILVSSDDYLSNNYLKEFKKAAIKLRSKSCKKFVLLPLFYKNIDALGFQFDFPLPIFFLNFIGICRGIGFGVYVNSGDIKKFDEKIKYASDFEYLIYCLKNNYHFTYVPCKYYHLKSGRSAQNWICAFKEEKSIAIRYNKGFFSRIMVNMVFKLKFLIRNY